jgi:hypothetical protein
MSREKDDCEQELNFDDEYFDEDFFLNSFDDLGNSIMIKDTMTLIIEDIGLSNC